MKTLSGFTVLLLAAGMAFGITIHENGYADCIIDCQYSGKGFIFNWNETNSSVLNGFSIINGNSSTGGGIQGSSSSPHITNCYIAYCTAGNGGGMYFTSCNGLLVTDCIIAFNNSTNT